jgi:hypothetical protein
MLQEKISAKLFSEDLISWRRISPNFEQFNGMMWRFIISGYVQIVKQMRDCHLAERTTVDMIL